MNADTHPSPVKVAALYRFVRVADPAGLKSELARLCCSRGLRGTVIVAHEGINGTIAGGGEAMDAVIGLLFGVLGNEGWEIKFSFADRMPFHRMKVKVKPEIVTMGIGGIDAAAMAGTHVSPAGWNALVADPETVVIDTRNDYEVALGSFEGAVDPGLSSFRDFPEWVERHRAGLDGRRIAMFCTGGIRCEKATAYLRSRGFGEVYHLKGGILRYLEDVSSGESLWNGECFVFDERVAVGHGLAQGEAQLCRGCRRPLTARDRASPLFVEGVSCAACHDERSQADRERYAERHRQVGLADRRGGEAHIGAPRRP